MTSKTRTKGKGPKPAVALRLTVKPTTTIAQTKTKKVSIKPTKPAIHQRLRNKDHNKVTRTLQVVPKNNDHNKATRTVQIVQKTKATKRAADDEGTLIKNVFSTNSQGRVVALSSTSQSAPTPPPHQKAHPPSKQKHPPSKQKPAKRSKPAPEPVPTTRTVMNGDRDGGLSERSVEDDLTVFKQDLLRDKLNEHLEVSEDEYSESYEDSSSELEMQSNHRIKIAAKFKDDLRVLSTIRSKSYRGPFRLDVRNLTSECTRKDLKMLCEHVGDVQSCKMNYNAHGKSRGNASVYFSKFEDAYSAFLEYNGRIFDDKRLAVDLEPRLHRLLMNWKFAQMERRFRTQLGEQPRDTTGLLPRSGA